MRLLLVGLLGALVAAGQASPASNAVGPTTNASAAAPEPADPVEREFQELMAKDDEAQEDADRMIRENDQFAAQGAGVSAAELRQRIRARLEPIRQAYEDFLRRHPKHVGALVAYGSFLGDFEGEDAAQVQYEKALALDTNNPAVYNNLANIYGHHGPVTKAFAYYARAIQLNPREPVYYQNFGTTVFLFRKDAEEFFHISEAEVFAKTFQLYSNAMRLDPENFALASDIAQTYYGIQPLRTDEALRAWTNALHLAHTEIEREGVYIHFARLKLLADRFAEARAHLQAVTNENYAGIKARLSRNLEARERKANGTNAPPKTEKPPR